MLSARLDMPDSDEFETPIAYALLAHCFTCGKDIVPASRIVQALNMREHFEAPTLMIGHSLGGTAILVAASDVEETNAIATIGAPSNTTNVMKQFGCDIEEIERNGEAEVLLAGRPFTIKKQFLDDIKSQNIHKAVYELKKPLLVCHSPIDDTVPISHAGDIYSWAMHPKSFMSLNTHDHLLFADGAAEYVARTVAAWASAYLPNQDN